MLDQVVATIEALERARLFWVLVPLGSKRPVERNWVVPRQRPRPESPTNVGLLIRDGVVDIDLDSVLAAKAAGVLVRGAPGVVRFGRRSRTPSHVLVREDGYSGVRRVVDPDSRALVLEVRTDKVQTIVPPSVHPSGEQLVWVDDPANLAEAAEPGTADRFVRKVAAAALLAEAWSPGIRHEAALALAGWLLRSGWGQSEVAELVGAVCAAAGDPEAVDRARAVVGTAETVAGDDPATGLPTLADLVGQERSALVARVLFPDSRGKSLKSRGGLEQLLQALEQRTDIVVTRGDYADECLAWTPDGWVRGPYGLFRPAVLEEVERLRMGPGWADRAAAVAKLVAGGAVPRLVKRPDELDPDPYLLGLPEGKAVDLRTGEVRPQTAGDLITRCTGVQYNPDASRSLLLETLEMATVDRGLVDYLQLLAGASLLGVPAKVVVVIHGPTDTGKTLFLVDGLRRALGSYAVELDPRKALANSERAELWWSRAVGSRVAILSEPPKDLLVDSAFLKATTGRGSVVVRRLYEQPREVTATWTVWVDTNYLPQVDDADEAVWRRIRAVRFKHRVRPNPDDPRYDPTFAERWQREAVPAVLAWAVEGAVRVVREYGDPSSLPVHDHDDTGEWRDVETEGTEADFVQQCLEPDESAFVPRKTVYLEYVEWASTYSRGGRVASRTALYAAVEAAGIRLVTLHGERGFKARLKPVAGRTVKLFDALDGDRLRL